MSGSKDKHLADMLAIYHQAVGDHMGTLGPTFAIKTGMCGYNPEKGQKADVSRKF